MEVDGEQLNVAEVAHIVAAEDNGPRSNEELTPEERATFDNLILLCPTCHTIVDKAPQAFPDTLIQQWKREHGQKLAATFGTQRYSSRLEARSALVPLLDENRTIFEQYGPYNTYKYNPESEQAYAWKRKVRTRILPNNRRILSLLDANEHLLSAREKRVLERLRQHVDDLEARHLGADTAGGGAQFPAAAAHLLNNETDDGQG